MDIDFKRLRASFRDPLWYLEFAPILKELEGIHDTNPEEYRRLKNKLYLNFERALYTAPRRIETGRERGIWDVERKPVDTIVLHHTHHKPGLTQRRLSAIELMRLYVPAYANPTEADKPMVSGKPISSGHFRGLAEVFWPYHWLIRKDGKQERLLMDNQIGWHAGKWEINCRSVAICFDGDFEHKSPSRVELESAADLIDSKYPSVARNNILGHCEVNLKTVCPSRLFLSEDGRRGWKEDLLALI